MTYTSSLYYMCIDPKHNDFSMKAYNSDEPSYVWKDNTVYARKVIWHNAQMNWLIEQGVKLTYEDNICYVPIANVDSDSLLTGWASDKPNIANVLLDLSESTRKKHYPNLFFAQIGNHPYPKHARIHTGYFVDSFNRECHRLIYPDPDPKKYFFRLKDILPF